MGSEGNSMELNVLSHFLLFLAGVVSLLLFSISLVVLVIFCLQTHKFKSRQLAAGFTVNQPCVFQTSLCLAFSIVTTFAYYQLAAGIFWIITESSISDDQFIVSFLQILINTGSFFLFITLSLCFPLFYFLRLYLTFKESTFALQNKTIIFYIILIIISTIIAIIGYICGITNDWNDTTYTIFAISSIISLFITSCICFQFCVKLFCLIEMQRNSRLIINVDYNHRPDINGSQIDNNMIDDYRASSGYEYDSYSYSIDNEITFNQKQEKLIALITKQSLLVFMGNFTLFLYDFSQAIISLSVVTDDKRINLILNIILGIVSFPATSVVPIVIWLSFSFASKQYDCICAKCDKCFANCCEFFAVYTARRRLAARS